MVEKSLKWVVIGTGMVAEHAHIPAISACPDAALVAVMDLNEAAARRVAQKNNIPSFYTDFDELIVKEKPDVVSVCVPNAFHDEVCLKALAGGANVFCEKPLALTYQRTKAVFDVAEAAGKLVMASQTARVNPDVMSAKKLMEDGVLGAVYYSEINRIRRRGVPKWGAFHKKATNGGGALCDIGVHQIDALLWILGNPAFERVTGFASAAIVKSGDTQVSSLKESGAPAGVFEQVRYTPDEFEVEEFANGMIVLEGPVAVNFKVAWSANLPNAQALTVLGDRGGLTLPELTVFSGVGGHQADSKLRIFNELPNNDKPFYGHYSLVNNFAKAVLGEESPLVKPEETLNVAAIIDAFYRSAELGREVTAAELY